MTIQWPRVGCAVIVFRRRCLCPVSVLMVRRGKPGGQYGKWVFPGGRIEAFESIDAAGMREVLEETGLSVQIVGQPEPAVYEWIDPGNEHRIVFYRLAEAPEGEPKAGGDALEARYVPLLDLILCESDWPLTELTRQVVWDLYRGKCRPPSRQADTKREP